MALSFVEYQGDGITTVFAVPFPYLSQTDVKVAIAGTDTAFTWTSPQTIKISPAPTNGEVVKIYRSTPNSRRLVDFEDDSILDEALLDQMSLQMFYIAQEAFDLSATSIVTVADGNYDARARRVKHVADPVEPTDAVNLRTFEGDFLPKLKAEADRAKTAADTSVSLKAHFDALFADLLYRSGLFDTSYRQIEAWKDEVNADVDTVVMHRQTVTTTASTVAADRVIVTEAKATILSDIDNARSKLNSDMAAVGTTITTRTSEALASLENKRATSLADMTAKHTAFTTEVDAAKVAIGNDVRAADADAAAAHNSALDAAAARDAAIAARDVTTAARDTAIAARDETLSYKIAIEAVGIDATALQDAVAQAEAAAVRAEEATLGTLTWDSVSNKPETFPPATHGHDWTEISNKPATYPATFHTHGWMDITDKPATYPATPHVHSYNSLTDLPTLFSGSYADLTGKPTTFAPSAHTHAWTEITGKPAFFSGSYLDLTNVPATFAPSAHTHAWTEITGKPTSFPSDWSTLANKPATYAPSAHTHDYLPTANPTVAGNLTLPDSTVVTGTTSGLRVTNASYGYVDIGNRNTSYTHYQSSTGSHYFYGTVHAQTDIGIASDARLKKNLEVIEGALDKVDQLTGYVYDRIDIEARQVGLIAQDVQEVLPEAVIQADGHLGVAYGNLVALLVNAIKELRQEVKELKYGTA